MATTTLVVTVNHPDDVPAATVAEALNRALDEPPCVWDEWNVGAVTVAVTSQEPPEGDGAGDTCQFCGGYDPGCEYCHPPQWVTDGAERAALIDHMHNDHGGYPAGHDFVLVGTRDIRDEHDRKYGPDCRPQS